MNLLPIQDRPAEPAAIRAERLSRTRPARRSAGFERVLENARPQAHTVQRGDTLSEIVHNHLRASGRRVSGSELYARVHQVARANGISNPDVISIGQKIDLAVLDGQGGPVERAESRPVPDQFAGPAGAAPSHALDHIVPGQTRISSGFGTRRDPFDGSVREHRGVDVAARRGSPIFPAAEGLVVFAGRHGGHGKTVIVRHADGSETLYAHADSLLVQEGDQVRRSDQLGLVGSSGRSTGPHLHFEVRRGGVAVDPLAALTAGE